MRKKREVNVEASLPDKTDRREYGIKEGNRRIYERVKHPTADLNKLQDGFTKIAAKSKILGKRTTSAGPIQTKIKNECFAILQD